MLKYNQIPDQHTTHRVVARFSVAAVLWPQDRVTVFFLLVVYHLLWISYRRCIAEPIRPLGGPPCFGALLFAPERGLAALGARQ